MLKAYRDDYGFHFSTKFFNTNINLTIYKTYRTTWTLGIRGSVPSSSRMVLFLDYDEHLLEFIIPEVKYLIQKYHLSSFYILKSSQRPNGFHVVCIDELTYREHMKIINETSCDEYYRSMPIRTDHHSWVLRILKKAGSPSPKLIKIIKSPFNTRKKSLAHYLYLKHQHGVMKRPKNLDKNKILYTIQYGTMNFIDANKIPKIKDNKPKNLKQPK